MTAGPILLTAAIDRATSTTAQRFGGRERSTTAR